MRKHGECEAAILGIVLADVLDDAKDDSGTILILVDGAERLLIGIFTSPTVSRRAISAGPRFVRRQYDGRGRGGFGCTCKVV